MTRLLIVRMSALGDIVHALPVFAAIRDALPHTEVDWLVDRKYSGILDFVPGLGERVIGRPGLSRAVAAMRARHYDAALDLQGLLKSAAMARLSGAERVIGFEQAALREKAAAWFYAESVAVDRGAHVVRKNLSMLSALGIAPPATPVFPIAVPQSAVADECLRETAGQSARYVLINPGAAWPNKRWAPARFGEVAVHLHRRYGLRSLVLWGSDEQPLADAVVAASHGTALRAPHTTLADLVALAARAALMIAGDTGPLHIAAALGTPVVGLFGPTWPERNGPWMPDDVVVSRAETCECHHKRRCQRPEPQRMCLDEISVDEVTRAIDRRLARTGTTAQ